MKGLGKKDSPICSARLEPRVRWGRDIRWGLGLGVPTLADLDTAVRSRRADWESRKNIVRLGKTKQTQLGNGSGQPEERSRFFWDRAQKKAVLRMKERGRACLRIVLGKEKKDGSPPLPANPRLWKGPKGLGKLSSSIRWKERKRRRRNRWLITIRNGKGWNWGWHGEDVPWSEKADWVSARRRMRPGKGGEPGQRPSYGISKRLGGKLG